jgi:anti-sigma factor RsiW
MNTACGEFENLLTVYEKIDQSERARVDTHVAQCAHCSALAQALSDVETALSAEYGDVCAPSSLLSRLDLRPAGDPHPKPSLLPEILDIVGWSAVACAAGVPVWFVAPPVGSFTGPMLYATAGVLTLSALAITFWALRANED